MSLRSEMYDIIHWSEFVGQAAHDRCGKVMSEASNPFVIKNSNVSESVKPIRSISQPIQSYNVPVCVLEDVLDEVVSDEPTSARDQYVHYAHALSPLM